MDILHNFQEGVGYPSPSYQYLLREYYEEPFTKDKIVLPMFYFIIHDPLLNKRDFQETWPWKNRGGMKEKKKAEQSDLVKKYFVAKLVEVEKQF